MHRRALTRRPADCLDDRRVRRGGAADGAGPRTEQQQQLPVSLEQALYLIRSTLLTLNDANRTGNYTVLRDLAAPDFQARNTAADLASVFTDLRRRNFDLFSVALAAPQLSAPPALDGNGMLRLTGAFPTRPLQINFDLLVPERRRAVATVRDFGRDAASTGAAAAGRSAERRATEERAGSQEEMTSPVLFSDWLYCYIVRR